MNQQSDPTPEQVLEWLADEGHQVVVDMGGVLLGGVKVERIDPSPTLPHQDNWKFVDQIPIDPVVKPLGVLRAELRFTFHTTQVSDTGWDFKRDCPKLIMAPF